MVAHPLPVALHLMCSLSAPPPELPQSILPPCVVMFLTLLSFLFFSPFSRRAHQSEVLPGRDMLLLLLPPQPKPLDPPPPPRPLALSHDWPVQPTRFQLLLCRSLSVIVQQRSVCLLKMEPVEQRTCLIVFFISMSNGSEAVSIFE